MSWKRRDNGSTFVRCDNLRIQKVDDYNWVLIQVPNNFKSKFENNLIFKGVVDDVMTYIDNLVPPPRNFRAGDSVIHDLYGVGTYLKSIGSTSPVELVEVNFKSIGTITIEKNSITPE